MKQNLLLLVIMLAWHYTFTNAQTAEFQMEEDGYEWFLISQNGKYGVKAFNGKTMLPIKYDNIEYYNGFIVKIGKLCEFYNVAGDCIISKEKRYKYININCDDKLGTYYSVQHEDGCLSLCNWKGEEVWTSKKSININFTHCTANYKMGYFYIWLFDDNIWKNYIINGDAEIICEYKEPEDVEATPFIEIDENKKMFYYESFGEKYKKNYICKISKIKTTENPFMNNGTDNKQEMFRKIGFTPYTGKVTKFKEIDGQTKYFLEKDGLKSVRDLNGKWVIPLCNDYKLLKINNQNYYLVNNNKFHFGLYSMNGYKILGMEYDMIEDGGWKYIKVKKNGNLGVFSVDGNEIIPINSNYTSIDKYNENIKGFAFTKKGYTGICDSQGREISITKLAPTIDDIKVNGGYSYVTAIYDGDTKYYRVGKGGRYGLTDAEGKVIVPTEMEALESAGTGYLRYKLNGFWGLMNYAGKIIIDTDRGYTSIGNFVTFTKRFPYTMNGYKGECDINGRQLSKIKVTTPPQNVASSSNSPSNSSSSTNSNSKSTTGTSTVVVEHHRDPVPVQEWQQCPACYGSGLCPYVQCGGSGWYYIGDKRSTCSRCHGTGKCTTCAGRGGQNVTVYR